MAKSFINAACVVGSAAQHPRVVAEVRVHYVDILIERLVGDHPLNIAVSVDTASGSRQAREISANDLGKEIFGSNRSADELIEIGFFYASTVGVDLPIAMFIVAPNTGARPCESHSGLQEVVQREEASVLFLSIYISIFNLNDTSTDQCLMIDDVR